MTLAHALRGGGRDGVVLDRDAHQLPRSGSQAARAGSPRTASIWSAGAGRAK